MPSPRARSPAPPSPLGPGTRPYSPARTPSPARRPTTDPPRIATPRGSPAPDTLAVPAPDDRSSTPLHHPQPTHLPSTAAAVLAPADPTPVSTAPKIRDSSVSAFDFMEAMLAPYEREDNRGDSDEEELYTDEQEELVTPVEPGPRVGDKRDKTPERVVGDERIRSLEGDVGEEGVIPFAPPRDAVKRQTVINFPAPKLELVKSRSPPMSQTLSQPSRQDPRIVTRAHIPPSQRGDAYTIPHLPSSGAPVSPHLAAPPVSPLSPPKSPFAASPDRSSGSSESITGFDLLKEKKALFRGGEEEVFSPISPRKGRQEGGLRPGAQPRAGVPSTMDFWKRFSMSVNKMEGVKMTEKGQDSEWLSDAQKRRNRIKCLLISGVIILALMAGGIAAGVVLSQGGHSGNESGASALCARAPAAGGGAAAGVNGAGPC